MVYLQVLLVQDGMWLWGSIVILAISFLVSTWLAKNNNKSSDPPTTLASTTRRRRKRPNDMSEKNKLLVHVSTSCTNQTHELHKEVKRLMVCPERCSWSAQEGDVIPWLCHQIIQCRNIDKEEDEWRCTLTSAIAAILQEVTSSQNHNDNASSQLEAVLDCITRQFSDPRVGSKEMALASTTAFILLQDGRCNRPKMETLFAKVLTRFANPHEQPPSNSNSNSEDISDASVKLISLVGAFASDCATTLAAWQQISQETRQGVLTNLCAALSEHTRRKPGIQAMANLSQADLEGFSLPCSCFKFLLELEQMRLGRVTLASLELAITFLFNACSNRHQDMEQLARAKIPTLVDIVLLFLGNNNPSSSSSSSSSSSETQSKILYLQQKSLATLYLLANLGEGTRASFSRNNLRTLQQLASNNHSPEQEGRSEQPQHETDVATVAQVVLQRLASGADPPSPHNAAARPSNPKLTNQQAQKLPRVVAPQCGSCCICLSEWAAQDTLVRLPVCSHQFHPECLESWVVGFSASCPYCRQDIVLDENSDNNDDSNVVGGDPS